jgi:hemolysin activation/secretion protein
VRGEVRANLINRSRYAVDVYGFYDNVWLWNLDRSTNLAENGRRLGSYGGGVRVILPRLAALDIAYARPEAVPLLGVPGARRATDRILVSLTFQFAPSR